MDSCTPVRFSIPQGCCHFDAIAPIAFPPGLNLHDNVRFWTCLHGLLRTYRLCGLLELFNDELVAFSKSSPQQHIHESEDYLLLCNP